MTWTLTINGSPVQNYVRPFSSLRVRHRGYLGAGTLSCRIVDQETSPGNGIYTVSINTEDDVTLVDSAVTTFAGRVRRRVRKDLNVKGIRVWDIECQDFNADPGDDWVPVGTGPRTTAETDKNRIAWLFSTYGTHSVDASTAFVQTVLGVNLPNQDFQGMTLAQALDEICKLTGAQWYVDYQHKLHYFVTESTAAPFSIDVMTPNNTTTFPCRDFEYPDDSIDYVNTVQVVGAGVTSTRYEGGSPPPAGKQRLYVLIDSSLKSTGDCDKAGDAILTQQAKRQDGQLTVWKPGLFPGMLLPIINAQWGINSSFRITAVEPQYIDLTQALYKIKFGTSPINLSDLWQKQVSITQAVSQLAESTASTTLDVTAPNAPTGLVLNSSQFQAPDGVLYPVIDADWNDNAEADLDAYEIQLDRALDGFVSFTTSASGTGGTLAAGTYRVRVTGLGLIQGECAADASSKLQAITAGQRLFVNITPKTGVTQYRVYAERVDDPRLSLTTSTTGSNVEVTTEGSGATAPLSSTALSFLTPQVVRTAQSAVRFSAVQGGVFYGARVRAIDDSGNYSTFSTVQTVTAAPDNQAPAIPEGLAATPGFRLVGLTWNRNAEIDIDKYEVRWSVDSGGNPDPLGWTKTETRSTVVVIQNLSPGTTYYFQVRAVDRSGNVRTSLADSTAVQANSNPEAGWSNVSGNYRTAIPVAVGQADIAANSIVSAMISTIGLDASVVKTGQLNIGGQPNTVDFLVVYDSSGVEIGRWDEAGLVVKDPSDPGRQLRYMNGVLEFTSDGGTTWTTGISADGIVADAIKLGLAPGGHNSIPNASFELSAFATLFTKVWTATTDWDDATSTVNLDVSGASLNLTTATF